MSRSLEFFGNEILDNNNWADNASIARRVTFERERGDYISAIILKTGNEDGREK